MAAMIQTSPLLSRIKGKIGNIVFSSHRKTYYVKEMAINHRYPRSDKQTAVNVVLGELSQTYKLLSPDQKRLWSQAAKERNESIITLDTETTVDLIKQIGHNISGYNLFISVNSSLILAGFDPIIVPPSGVGYGINIADFFSFAGIPVINFKSVSINKGDDYLRCFTKIHTKRGLKYIDSIHWLQDYFTEVYPGSDITGIADATIIFPLSEVFDDDEFKLVPNLQLYGYSRTFQADVINPNGMKSSPTANVKCFLGPFGQNRQGEKWLHIWTLTNNNFKQDCGVYANYYGILPNPIYSTKDAGMYWFSLAVLLFCDSIGINLFENDINSPSDLVDAGCPRTIKDFVELGFLPTVPNFQSLTRDMLFG